MRVLALNVGSSSLKAVLRDPDVRLRATAERLGDASAALRVHGEERPVPAGQMGDAGAALTAIAAAVGERGAAPDVVAHRIVHGGPRHSDHTLVDARVLADLHEAVPLAPLHLPGALAVLEQAKGIWPDAVQVACLDTAFFRDLPEAAIRLPVPEELAATGVRRYGFHGLSMASALRSEPPLGNAVIAHLGSGCSVTAVDDAGRPRHTTMSMTPTGGMVSGTRPGDLDPEIVLYLIEQHGYSVARLRELFDRRSGLAGLARGRHDVRDLAAATDHDAVVALEVFARSAAMAIAGCATTLNRWDSLVFTGGVGEHADALRASIVARLHLPATVRVRVVEADEEAEMDRIARRLADGDLPPEPDSLADPS